jgi:hypothetical protein
MTTPCPEKEKAIYSQPLWITLWETGWTAPPWSLIKRNPSHCPKFGQSHVFNKNNGLEIPGDAR